jgi:16S rRNA (guanine527-N7)-methyltransferase
VSERPIPQLLLDTLRHAQRVGMLGDRPVEQVVAHARWFVAAIDELVPPTTDRVWRVVDLGSGGGVPGLVVAVDRPDLDLSLVDRRAKRTDFLELALGRFRRAGLLGPTVQVRCADVEELAREVADGRTPAFDIATARGFGPPETTLRAATSVVGQPGWIVVSEPPTGDRWDPAVLATLGLRRRTTDRVVVFERPA